MGKRTDHITADIYLHPYGVEEELSATFEIEIETYPAEPFSYGAGRGTETTVIAKLICFTRFGETLTRDVAVDWDGEEEVMRQEEAIGETYEPEVPDRSDFGDWLRDQAMDRMAEPMRIAAE